MSSDARTLRVALRDLILGDDARAAAAAQRLAARALWPVAIALSGQWRMTPVVRERITRLGARLGANAPDTAGMATLRAMTVAASAHSALAVRRSREALALLENAGIAAAAIKGVALIAGLYGHRSLRMVGDLDIIVSGDAFAAALSTLEADGYTDPNKLLERHLSDIALSPRLHNVARNLKRDGFEIDVHSQFGSNPPPAFRTAAVIARSHLVSLGGTPIRVAAPADAMSIAAHHSLRGYFAPNEVVKDAYDLAAWWTLRRDAWDLGAVVDAALAAEVGTALYALWALVERCDPAHPVSAGTAALGRRLGSRARIEAERLAGFCEEQFARGSRAERTVQLFDAARLGRTLLGHGHRLLAGAPDGGSIETPPLRRPLRLRAAAAARRVVRVLRELVHVRSYARYRALARAQGRHH